jgi:hypothetical protein
MHRGRETSEVPRSLYRAVAPEHLQRDHSRSDLFTVAICDAFATESCGNPVARFGNSMFPGAFASNRLLVRTQTTTVLIRLALTRSVAAPAPDAGTQAQSPWARQNRLTISVRGESSAARVSRSNDGAGSATERAGRRVVSGLPCLVDDKVPCLRRILDVTPSSQEFTSGSGQQTAARQTEFSGTVVNGFA